MKYILVKYDKPWTYEVLSYILHAGSVANWDKSKALLVVGTKLEWNIHRSTVSSETFPGTTLSPPSTQPSGLKAQKGVSPGSTKITTSTDAQTSPENTK